jgi:hypothetical protein
MVTEMSDRDLKKEKNGFRVETIFCVSLILLVLSGVHILSMLFGFIYAYTRVPGKNHIVVASQHLYCSYFIVEVHEYL